MVSASVNIIGLKLTIIVDFILLLNIFMMAFIPDLLVWTSSLLITRALAGEPPWISSLTFDISFSQVTIGVSAQPAVHSVVFVCYFT